MTAVHPNTPVCWEHDYRLEDRQLHGAFVAGLDPVLEDFIDIAVAASIKDRSVLRSPPGQWDGYRRGWRRHTTLDVPVR